MSTASMDTPADLPASARLRTRRKDQRNLIRAFSGANSCEAKNVSSDLEPGLYDHVITKDLGDAIDRCKERGWTPGIDVLDNSTASTVLARYLGSHIVGALEATRGEGADRIAAQIALANRLLETIADATSYPISDGDRLVEPGKVLLDLIAPASHLGTTSAPPRPLIPLRTSLLLVNGHRDHNIGRAVASELASAKRVDLLCAFVRWTGVLVIHEALQSFFERGGALRVLTTVYTGATQRRALDELVKLGATVKVSYETDQTRLHAKAWLFHRSEGLSTAYIGSSNLSRAALVDGLEWNVRTSETDNAGILDRFRAVFDQYWSESGFTTYDPAVDGERLDEALRQQSGHTLTAPFQLHVDVAPKTHQVEILERLDAERQRGHRKNLVVAATGTGKTWVAAFDYARLRQERGRASLLFVAHRKEILQQSLAVFRQVLRDNSFGELLVDGARPIEGRHVFASIQSLNADRLTGLQANAYDVVIIDEFHHAAAPSYEALLHALTPGTLLGLTATPERADGQDILKWFDGRIAADLRLWKALDQGLLCPFQYFGIHDGTDLSQVAWVRGRYDLAALERLYTGHHVRARLIIDEVVRHVLDASSMRALGFCVGVDHALFMAKRFAAAGIKAVAIHGGTLDQERRKALADLRDGNIQVVFSVDLFNEGVDLPEVDTVLFLRPTESATVFLQQLGRGLRWSPGKGSLLVLDFIGNAHQQFRFDIKYRAITGGTRRDFAKQVEAGFPLLPPGCSLQLDRMSREAVLSNVRTALRLGRSPLVDDLRALGDISLKNFVAETGIELEDIYAKPQSAHCWTELRRLAGLSTPEPGPNEMLLGKAFGRILHVDDPVRLDAWRNWLANDEPPKLSPSDTTDGRLQLMLFAALGNRKRPISDVGLALGELWNEPAMRTELLALLELLGERSRSAVLPFDDVDSVPLLVHGTYSLGEILAAFKIVANGRIREFREGVLFDPATNSDLLFVTLVKSEQDYSVSTRYDDRPTSPVEFHWESQRSTRAESTTGQRYVNHGSTVLLFVREKKKDSRGATMAYMFLGPVSYLRHEGERPMRVDWALKHPMPAEMFQSAKAVAG
jgi:superfamily II DNA or RNA helicase/HKD family nuclease